MTKDRQEASACYDSPGVTSALDAVGHRWTFHILHAISQGIHHFDDMRRELKIAGNILTCRLKDLVEHGVLARKPLEADRRKVRYTLTEKGEALLPILDGLDRWGRMWCAGSERGAVRARRTC